MTEVLYPPRKPSGHSYYSSSPLKRSSASYSSFLSQAASPYTVSRSSPPTPPTTGHTFASSSVPSNGPASSYQQFPAVSTPSLLPPTPASSVSFEDKDDRDTEDIAFPSYDDGVQFYHTDEPLDLPSSPSEESDAGSTAREASNASESIRSDSPLPTPIVADDTAVKPNPSRHVDYLSHDWREEDIWSSWRHIVSQRKVYGQRSRLENASWRTWAKSKYRLPTVSPETLNWLKESDVTWLYGPLQPATSHPITHRSPDPSPYHLSSQSSFINKKPILKKRSMSEVMLQRSLSANSLVKQAAAAVQAQQKGHPHTPTLQRGSSDFNSSVSQSRPISRDQLDYFSTIHSSGNTTPSDCTKRHIRFDDKVEQCIAVECKFPDQDECFSESDSDDSNSDSSDEGVLTMRKPRRRRATMGRTSSRPQMPTKSIEKLPDTTLKYKTESPESSRTSIPVPFLNSWYQSSKLNQSPSQETLRPSNPSRNFLIPADDDGDDVDPEMSWQPSGAYAGRHNSPAMGKVDDDEEVPSNMRRTPSGMFMPYDEDEDDAASELGLFGRVSETINTARDIAHVIWNVGWRK